jgi:hypothetical protein
LATRKARDRRVEQPGDLIQIERLDPRRIPGLVLKQSTAWLATVCVAAPLPQPQQCSGTRQPRTRGVRNQQDELASCQGKVESSGFEQSRKFLWGANGRSP